MDTKNVIIAVLVILILLLLVRNYNLMYPMQKEKPVDTKPDICSVGSFYVTKDYSAQQFKFDVNTPTTRNLRVLRSGDCIAPERFSIRKNSGQEDRYVTFDGFDITDAGSVVTQQ